MENILNGGQKQDARAMDIIKGNISNADDVLKSEKELSLEESIRKGDVEVISMDDLKESYNNTFYKGEDIDTMGKNLDILIEKGESEYLEEDEFEALEKGLADYRALERKAIATPRGEGVAYKEVYVMPVAEATDED